jgi:hypothetical protein
VGAPAIGGGTVAGFAAVGDAAGAGVGAAAAFAVGGGVPGTFAIGGGVGFALAGGAGGGGSSLPSSDQPDAKSEIRSLVSSPTRRRGRSSSGTDER